MLSASKEKQETMCQSSSLDLSVSLNKEVQLNKLTATSRSREYGSVVCVRVFVFGGRGLSYKKYHMMVVCILTFS